MVTTTTSITRRLAAGTAAVALSLTVAACAGGANASAGGSDTLTVAINGDPQSLDPGKNGGGAQQLVQWLSYEPLIRAKADGSFDPGLAESWKYVADDNTAFELTLRKGAQFADGTPVTADDVVKSIQYFIATPSPVHSLIEGVSNVEATDDRTVRVTFAHSTPDAPSLFSQVTNYGDIISAAGLANPDQLGTATFGAGPYTLDRNATVSGDHYTFVKNDKYWNADQQHYKKVVVRIIGDSRTALNAVRTGQVNVSTVTTPAQLPDAKSAGLDVVSGGRLSIMVWLMDRNGETLPALGDVRVRRALNMAIDRKAIASALGDAYEPLSQFVAPGGQGYADDIPNYKYDVDGAKALLKEAGVGSGFTMALATNTDNRDAEVSQILAEQWRKIGVTVDLKTYDNQPSEMFGAIADKKFPAVTFALSASMPQMQPLLTQQSVFNPFAVSAPEVDQAFQAFDVAPIDRTDATAQDVSRAVNDAAWFVPVVSVQNYLFAKGVDHLGHLSNLGYYDVLDWTPAT